MSCPCDSSVTQSNWNCQSFKTTGAKYTKCFDQEQRSVNNLRINLEKRKNVDKKWGTSVKARINKNRRGDDDKHKIGQTVSDRRSESCNREYYIHHVFLNICIYVYTLDRNEISLPRGARRAISSSSPRAFPASELSLLWSYSHAKHRNGICLFFFLLFWKFQQDWPKNCVEIFLYSMSMRRKKFCCPGRIFVSQNTKQHVFSVISKMSWWKAWPMLFEPYFPKRISPNIQNKNTWMMIRPWHYSVKFVRCLRWKISKKLEHPKQSLHKFKNLPIFVVVYEKDEFFFIYFVHVASLVSTDASHRGI